MANATANVQLNVTGNAQQQLQKLQKSVNSVQSSFAGLRNALGGIAIGAFVTNTFRFADAMDDLSKATNIGLESVVGFGRAVQQNGGTLEGAENALNKFVITIGEAAQGSKNAQSAFAKVGVSLKDLRNLSEEDLLRKTIKGLGEIKDASERAKVSNEIFSKSLRGTDLTALAGDFDKATGSAKAYADSIRSAAEVQQTLENTVGTFKNELLVALKPLTDFINKLDKDDIAKFTKAIAELAVSIGGLVAVLKAVQIVGALALGAFAMMRQGAIQVGNTSKTAAIQAKGFSKAWTEASGIIESAMVLLVGLAARLKNIGFLLGGIVRFIAPLYAVAEILSRIVSGGDKGALDYFDTLIKKIKDFLGLKSEAEKFDARKMGAREATPEESGVFFPTGDNSANREIIDSNEQLSLSIADVTKSYAEQNNQLQTNLANQLKYMQVSIDEAEILQAQDQIRERSNEAVAKLVEMKDKLQDKEKELIPIIDAQIESIRLQEQAQITAVKTNIEAIQQYKNAQEELKASIEDTARAFAQAEAMQDLQDQLSLVGLYGEELEKQTVILQAQKALREEMQRLSVELLNLEAQRTQLGEVAYQRERQRITQQMMDVQSLAEAKISAYEQEMEKKKQIDESYAEGAARALKDIADQYKPINLAQEAVQKGWGRISDAVDTFVETGKFKFSDFARSVLQDLAKMIAKALIFKAISAALGAFGLKLPGLAAGGPAEAGQPYIVGEKGPELFVPQNSGKVIPNNQLGKGTGAVSAPITNNYNTYNINALDAKSVATLFAENRKAIFGANKMAEREMSYAGAR
jgi:lambda family phage tail tape measure protein